MSAAAIATLRRNTMLAEPLPWLVLTASALLLLGVVMIASASMDMAAATMGNSYHYAIRQLIFAGIGCTLALAAANVPISW
ncbi:FtsW/RodA/SpoVE family cell cycle protein, partial [uncultured Marinobacter sp.]|uniref:FtsW/RodA/SpoVE family cell cycle protein n=1 Tax=uncultured Marinobacter sp. TaxID=187379 RepID=UPI0030DC62D8